MSRISLSKPWLKENTTGFGDDNVYLLYLDLLKAESLNLTDVAKEAISRYPLCRMLQKIANLLPNDIAKYEMILEKKNATQLLDYLESSQRSKEGLTLIKRNKTIFESRVNDFFKKHKKEFSTEAEQYFCEIIDKNLQFTGDRYYYAIADAIQQVKQINANHAIELVRNIRLNYKRRIKLMSLLAKF